MVSTHASGRRRPAAWALACRVRGRPNALSSPGPLMCAQVEKAPVVIKGSVPKADAENMKKQIEAGEAHACMELQHKQGK